MSEDPMDEFYGIMRGYFPELTPPLPSKPYYPHSGYFSAENSPLPKGFEVDFCNAMYYPMFDGASYRVVLDLGNGKIIFYPSGFAEISPDAEYLGVVVRFNHEVVLERKV